MEKPKKNIFVIFFLIIVAILLWSRFISTRGLITKEYGIINNKIPASMNGLKIVHFSDLHFGRTIDEKGLKNIVKKINNLKPQIIVFTGDLIDKDVVLTKEKKESIIKILQNLNSEIDSYAVLGNHDYEKEDSKEILINSNFNILEDNYQLIYYKSTTPILLVGLKSSIKEHPNFDNAIKDLTIESSELYKIVLAHEPDQLNNLKDYSIDLMLAGHSHNGQVRLPFVGAIIKPIGAKIYYDEFYQIDETKLYISSGIGTSEINFRFFNKPSINLYRLYNN